MERSIDASSPRCWNDPIRRFSLLRRTPLRRRSDVGSRALRTPFPALDPDCERSHACNPVWRPPAHRAADRDPRDLDRRRLRLVSMDGGAELSTPALADQPLAVLRGAVPRPSAAGCGEVCAAHCSEPAAWLPGHLVRDVSEPRRHLLHPGRADLIAATGPVPGLPVLLCDRVGGSHRSLSSFRRRLETPPHAGGIPPGPGRSPAPYFHRVLLQFHR